MPLDRARAVCWRSKAASQGSSLAQFNLGVALTEGDGVAQDRELAFRWYEKAAAQGLKQTQFNLAVMLGKGDGIRQDREKAAHWCRQATEQGCASAIRELRRLESRPPFPCVLILQSALPGKIALLIVLPSFPGCLTPKKREVCHDLSVQY